MPDLQDTHKACQAKRRRDPALEQGQISGISGRFGLGICEDSGLPEASQYIVDVVASFTALQARAGEIRLGGKKFHGRAHDGPGVGTAERSVAMASKPSSAALGPVLVPRPQAPSFSPGLGRAGKGSKMFEPWDPELLSSSESIANSKKNAAITVITSYYYSSSYYYY